MEIDTTRTIAGATVMTIAKTAMHGPHMTTAKKTKTVDNMTATAANLAGRMRTAAASLPKIPATTVDPSRRTIAIPANRARCSTLIAIAPVVAHPKKSQDENVAGRPSLIEIIA